MNASLPLPIRTARLTLRDFVPSDLTSVLAYTSDPLVTRFMYCSPMSLSQTHEFLLQVIGAQRQRPRASWELAVVRSSDQALLGACDISLDEHGDGDLGYILARFAWGHGYASEAAAAIVRHGFNVLRLPRIFGLCHVAHRASARVLEKAGLRRESLIERCKTVKGEQWDMLVYSRTRETWDERASGRVRQ